MTNGLDPLFLHIHLPKTAGTSLNSLLGEWFGEGFIDWYDPDPNRVYSVAEIEQKIAASPAVRCVTSHSIRTYPESIAGRPAYYITFLREPMDRIISDCTYTQKHYPNFSTEHKSSLPPEFANASLTQMLEYWLKRSESLKRSHALVGNPICHFYAALFVARHQRTLARLQRVRGLSAVGQKIIFYKTKALLDRFFFVGITAEFERDVARLAQKLRALGVTAACEATALLNQSNELRAKWNMDDAREILRGLQSFCRADDALYRIFYDRARSLERVDSLVPTTEAGL